MYKDLAAVHTQHLEHLSNHHSKIRKIYQDTFKAHLDNFANIIERHANNVKDGAHPEHHKVLHAAVCYTALTSVDRLKAHMDHHQKGANVFKKSMQRLTMGMVGVLGLSGSLMAYDGLTQPVDSGDATAGATAVNTSKEQTFNKTADV